jgi:N-acetylmuramoyl-L-alanine amidase
MRQLLFLLILLCSALPVWAQAPFHATFRGQDYHFQPTMVQGKAALNLADPQVVALIQATSAQVQVSTSGRTLYVFLPGRQTYWSDGAGVFTRNGKELEAPGLFFTEPAASMEPLALFEAIGLRAYPVAEGYQLASLVTDFGPSAPDSLELKMVTSAPLKFVATEPEQGQIRVEIAEAAWDREERKFRMGEADVEIFGGDKPGVPLVAFYRFQPFWTAKVKFGLTREILVSPEPRQYVSATQQVTLQDVKDVPGADGTREIEFVLDRGTQFFWTLDATSRTLKVEFPATTSTVNGVRVLKTANFPVSRYEAVLAEGQSFEFYQDPEQPNSLRLKLAPAAGLKPVEAAGTASMAGSYGAAGSIVLDPGHGGGDPGCCNRGLNVWEKDVTLDICLRMRDLLQKQGWKVEMTRTTDRDVTYAGSPDLMELKARADVANNNNSDLFVSVHCNASVSTASRGSAIYWYKQQDQALAQYLDVLDDRLGFEQDGTIRNSFAVLRLTQMPAVLVETAFLTNPTEGRLLATPEIRQKIAELLCEALGKYMAAAKRR